jgi:hypothetical protein
MDSTGSSGSTSSSLSRSRVWLGRIGIFQPRGPVLFLFFLFFAALLVSRRFDCVQNPQFWAEDGTHFFTDAREHSAWANLAAYSYGYFDLIVRIAHQVAVLGPLEKAPLVLVLFAIVIQAAVPAFVISSRCEGWMGPFPIRLAAAILYCAMPNSFETHCIALHSRVHLAVLAALVIVSAPPRSVSGKLLDVATLILSGLSGPFVLLLAPVAIWRHWRMRSPVTRRNYLILAATWCCAIFALINSIGSRLGSPRGAGFFEAIRIIGGQLTMGFFLGKTTFQNIVNQPYFDVVAGLSFIALSILVFLIIRRERWELRCLLFIGAGAVALALSAPIGGAPGMTQWHALWSIPGNGQRYYFLPMAMMLFVLAAVAGRGQGRVWRASAMALLLLIATMGARVDWILPAFANFHFNHYISLYRSIPPGTSMTVPINPPGWQMELKKPALDRR